MKFGLLRVGTLSVFILFMLTVRRASGISRRGSLRIVLCIYLSLHRRCLANSTAHSSSQRPDKETSLLRPEEAKARPSALICSASDYRVPVMFQALSEAPEVWRAKPRGPVSCLEDT